MSTGANAGEDDSYGTPPSTGARRERILLQFGSIVLQDSQRKFPGMLCSPPPLARLTVTPRKAYKIDWKKRGELSATCSHVKQSAKQLRRSKRTPQLRDSKQGPRCLPRDFF